MLHFALGKEFEDLGSTLAHSIMSRGLRSAATFDQLRQRAHIAEIDRIIRAQTRAWLASCRPASRGRSCFRRRLPRTGTTLVEGSLPAIAR